MFPGKCISCACSEKRLQGSNWPIRSQCLAGRIDWTATCSRTFFKSVPQQCAHLCMGKASCFCLLQANSSSRKRVDL